jgi:hypothetical protein
MILIQNSEEGVRNLKFILLCFELLSGLKINFHKSEVIIMGGEAEEQARVARILNCKQGSFPFTYLGFTMNEHKLSIADMEPLVATVGKRAAPWQGRFMSSAARLTLIDACLSNLPLHTMALFLLADGTHAGFDKHRNRFFWEGQGTKKKYHWVNWQDICQPKSQGGLGVMNTKAMNICLMAKWLWRMFAGQDNDLLWLKLLRTKYRTQDFFWGNAVGGSPFWHSLHKIKNFFKLGVRFHPGCNANISFWNDLWIGEEPLSVRFPNLFNKSSDTDLKLSQAHSQDGWRITFRRNLTQEDLASWQQLCGLVEDIDLEDVPTSISWRLEQSGKFSTRSLYLALCKKPEVPLTKFIWDNHLPLKIKIFTWQLSRGRLPCNDQIHARGGCADGLCALCGQVETVDHLFFQCPLACFLWSGVRDQFSVDWNPKSRVQWFAILNSLNPKTQRPVWVFFAALAWALWTTRNKFTIERKFPRHPADVVYKLIISLQLWRPLQSPKEQAWVDEMLAMARSFFAISKAFPASSTTAPLS